MGSTQGENPPLFVVFVGSVVAASGHLNLVGLPSLSSKLVQRSGSVGDFAPEAQGFDPWGAPLFLLTLIFFIFLLDMLFCSVCCFVP